jgi:hypothetical protein
VQNPDVQSLGAVQAWPLPIVILQTPPLQVAPDAQSASVEQVVAQAVPAHRNGAQFCTVAGGHVAAFPLQLVAAVETPALQLAARHEVAGDAKASVGQALLPPSQVSATSQTSVAVRQTLVLGSGLQVPSEADRSQA